MPKKVTISISAIVKDVDKALEKMKAGKALAPTLQEKSLILAKIKLIKQARKELYASCKGGKSMTVTVPGA